MTELLFRQDVRATSFDASVMDVRGQSVRLNRTLFYPEGGGQSADVGRLMWTARSANVTDVSKDGEDVWHTLEGDVPGIGDTVRGEVDWTTRWRHMQRHTGEHLLAQAFLRVSDEFRVQAVSMRSPNCTLDLSGSPTLEDARKAEAVLRAVIRRDLRVEAFEVPAEDLGNYPLRRPTKVQGSVRLVGVREEDGNWWEMSACGGTHLPSTAFAAPVVVLGLERVKGGLTRVNFMAGEEASEYLGDVYQQARTVAQHLSVPVDGLVGRFEAMREDAERTRQDLERARAGWASALVAASEEKQGVRFIRVPEPALVVHALKAIVERKDSLGVVLADDGRCGVASTRTDAHAGQLLQNLLKQAGGRGGGKADVAQGQTTDVTAFERSVRALSSTNV